MNLPWKRIFLGWGFVLVVLSAGTGKFYAQTPGVTDQVILIGSCAALEGPSSFLGRETVNRAETYFQRITEEGGVNGRKLRLVSHDDSYDPGKTQACSDKTIVRGGRAVPFTDWLIVAAK
jgi:branched-chain amino acid transport system substrate-binding protein